MQAHTMARKAAAVGAEGAEKVDGVVDAVIHLKQMETTNHTGNACFATDRLGMANDVANTAVGTASDDKKPLIGATAEGLSLIHI